MQFAANVQCPTRGNGFDEKYIKGCGLEMPDLYNHFWIFSLKNPHY